MLMSEKKLTRYVEIYTFHHGSASLLTESVETSKAKVTVEMSQSSVKMRAAAQLPAIGPDDDLTGILLQVPVRLAAEALRYLHVPSLHRCTFCFRYSP